MQHIDMCCKYVNMYHIQGVYNWLTNICVNSAYRSAWLGQLTLPEAWHQKLGSCWRIVPSKGVEHGLTIQQLIYSSHWMPLTFGWVLVIIEMIIVGWTGIYNFYNRQDDIAFVFSGGISCSISYNIVSMAHGANEPLKAGNWRWLPVEGVKGRRIGDFIPITDPFPESSQIIGVMFSSVIPNWGTTFGIPHQVTWPWHCSAPRKMQQIFASARIDDDAMCEAMKRSVAEFGYLPCPHTAVALRRCVSRSWNGSWKILKDASKGFRRGVHDTFLFITRISNLFRGDCLILMMSWISSFSAVYVTIQPSNSQSLPQRGKD